MAFTNPAGLWFMLGIPLLLLLFFLRPKFEEQNLSSTFLWRLSVKYRKKRMTVSRLRRLMILALQLLLILLLSLVLSGPRLMADGFGTDYVVILDTSASMAMTDVRGTSMLELALQDIHSLAERVRLGSRMTVFTTDSENCHLLERSDSVAEINRALAGVQCTQDAGAPQAAIAAAQEMLRLRPDAQVFYYTDSEIPQVDHISVVNVVPQALWNAAVSTMESRSVNSGMAFTAAVTSYAHAAQLTAGLYIDGTLTSAQVIDCPKDEEIAVEWRVADLSGFESARMVLEADDALDIDNYFTLYPQPVSSASVALVSDHPFYLEHAFAAFSGLKLTAYAHPWEVPASGFDLIVYEGCAPQELPEGSAIWLIDPPRLPEDIYGLALGETVPGGCLSRADASVTGRVSELLSNLANRDTVVSVITHSDSTGALTPLLRCGEENALLAGFTDAGAPLVVMPFDLRNTNLPLQTDFIFLTRNILRFALPSVLEPARVITGEPAQALACSGCTQAFLRCPDGTEEQLPLSEGVIPFTARSTGEQALVQVNAEGKTSETPFFACLPASESGPDSVIQPSIYLVRPETADQTAQVDGLDLRLLLSALLLLLLILECVVYNRERI